MRRVNHLSGLLAAVAIATAAWAEAPVPVDPHAHHHMDPSTAVQRSTADYAVPAVSLVRDDGVRVAFPAEIDDGRPVVLNFIYTTCTTICPLSSAVFSQFQAKLGAAQDQVHLVSVSIDPEQDTPPRLRAYAKRFHAGPEWRHYTGSVQASLAVQRAFNVYRGDKMSHTPVTLLRATPGQPWVRLDGFATADDLYREFQAFNGNR
jgi:protein SCO1